MADTPGNNSDDLSRSDRICKTRAVEAPSVRVAFQPREEFPLLRALIQDYLSAVKDVHVHTVGCRLLDEIGCCIETGFPGMFFLVAQAQGRILGVTNGCLILPDVGLSYHTLSLPAGHHKGCGSALFRAKCRYFFSKGVKHIYACPESPNGERLCLEHGFHETGAQHPPLLPWEEKRYLLRREDFAPLRPGLPCEANVASSTESKC